MILGFLILGAIACYVSMFGLVTPQHSGGGSWDLSPLAGFIIGAPTWLISFPIIYFPLYSKIKHRPTSYMIATIIAFILTLLIPYLIIRS